MMTHRTLKAANTVKLRLKVADRTITATLIDTEAARAKSLKSVHGAESQTTDLKSRAAARFVLH